MWSSKTDFLNSTFCFSVYNLWDPGKFLKPLSGPEPKY